MRVSNRPPVYGDAETIETPHYLCGNGFRSGELHAEFPERGVGIVDGRRDRGKEVVASILLSLRGERGAHQGQRHGLLTARFSSTDGGDNCCTTLVNGFRIAR